MHKTTKTGNKKNYISRDKEFLKQLNFKQRILAHGKAKSNPLENENKKAKQ